MESTPPFLEPFDKDRLLHLIVIDKRNQKILLSVKFNEFNKDPESLAISYNPFDTHSGPLYVVSKPEFRILIEGGGWPPISSKNAVLLFVQETPDSKTDNLQIDDEKPYRQRMRMILDLMEKGGLDSTILDYLKDRFPTSQAPEPHWLHVLILQNLLSSLDLEWVGLLDINPFNLMKAIWTIPTSPEKRERIRNLVFDELCAQIDRGGTTIGLDVERMAEYEILAKRTNRVLEMRKMEIEGMQSVVVSHDLKDGYDIALVDLEPLWYTAYGNQVLKELNLGKSCDGEDFIDIKEEFEEIGVPLPDIADSQGAYHSILTQAMKEYIQYVSQINVEGLSSYQNGMLIDTIHGIMS